MLEFTHRFFVKRFVLLSVSKILPFLGMPNRFRFFIRVVDASIFDISVIVTSCKKIF